MLLYSLPLGSTMSPPHSTTNRPASYVARIAKSTYVARFQVFSHPLELAVMLAFRYSDRSRHIGERRFECAFIMRHVEVFVEGLRLMEH
jgi:hypothetical protein